MWIIVLLMSSLSSENYQFLESQKFRLPKMQFTANDVELNLLKKKLLADSYNQQIRNKYSSSKVTDNPEVLHFNQPTYIDINMAHVQYEKKVKMDLAKQYQKQKEMKLAGQKQSKQRKLEEEKKMIQNLQQMNRLQQERKKGSQFKYRSQMTEQLQTAKLKRLHELEQANKQKEEFNHKYGVMRSNSEENLKLNKFKHHFDLVNEAQTKIENEYLYKWSPIIKTKQDEKQRLIEAGITKVHDFQKLLNQRKEENERRHRTELRQALQKQIKQKQELRKNQRLRNKSQAYIPHSYRNLHHPIYNPVDFKMAHDNKRILKQLKQEQEKEAKLSGLAKNGSLVFMPFYPTQ